MDNSTAIVPPEATTEDVAQAEAENTVAATTQPGGNALSSDAHHHQSRRTSSAWSIFYLRSSSTFYSLSSKSYELLGRYRTSIYKNSLKLLGVFCALGALTLAWIALQSPMKPNNVDIQSLAALNKSAGSQSAIYEALQESLDKLREELDTEKKQLEIDRELLRNEANQLDLQKWAARRQFVKECLEYQKVRPGKAFFIAI